MLRRSFLVMLSGSALLPAVAQETTPLSAAYTHSIPNRLEMRLVREGFTAVGEWRRKGDFVVVTASKASIPWRLVLDGRTGEIIGQKPLSSGSAND